MIETAFAAAMAAAGLAIRGQVVADGKLCRVHIDGDKPGSRNGWYILFADGIPSGAFGSWKTGIKGKWCAKKTSDLTQTELAEHKRRMDAAIKARDAEDKSVKLAAREKAKTIWQAAPPAHDDHPYLIKKRVKAHGLRLSGGTLVIPVRDSAGVLHSLQFIDADGNKRFLTDGQKKGCYFSIGQPTDTLCIAEGYATAASIHEATGHAVTVAFDAGNLMPVAQALRQKFPNAKIIICADNDAEKPGNPGLTKAKAAASATGAFLAYPGRK